MTSEDKVIKVFKIIFVVAICIFLFPFVFTIGLAKRSK
jgi:Na+/phosphate symporter